MRLGVNVVIRDGQGRVLLARRDQPPIWNLPGGGVEPNEAPWNAAIRETAEEVGLVVEVLALTGVYDRSPDGDPVFVFTARVTGGELTTTAESVETGWFQPDDLPTPINPYQSLRISDAAAGEPAAALRHQPGPSVRSLFPDQ
ncbi:MAG TPA: NUDIX domain-containing protein [Mycobacteriales bacterium]|jgi:ADP-ribose pyrophosphatase YjhB (NUDIX family)|nr:NUDIX domain-containing protein [Mycobacteriales bacterium]